MFPVAMDGLTPHPIQAAVVLPPLVTGTYYWYGIGIRSWFPHCHHGNTDEDVPRKA